MSDRFPYDGLVDARAVAAFLSVGRDWVYDHKHLLAPVKVGGALRFEAREVREYVRRSREQPPTQPVSRARTSRYDFPVLRAA